jgi:tRNA threonylcarbamoyladenosine biosynthesis protein TsaE
MATDTLAERIAEVLEPGDTILIDGPIGAGKSHFCRAAIRHLLDRDGRQEDIPSPTFTLVQTYETGAGEVWHSDLYRLTDVSQVLELGLEEAFSSAIVLVEWPDRLGALAPRDALRISLTPTEEAEARRVTLLASGARWRKLAGVLAHPATEPHLD